METGQQNNDKQQNAVSINNPDESLSAPKSVKKSAEKKAKSDRPKKAAKQAEAIKPKAAAKKPTPKKVSSVATKAKVLKKATKPAKKTAATKIIFQLKFHTKPGQLLFVTGDHPIVGNENIANALPLQYLNEETWAASVDIDAASVPEQGIQYNYILKNQDGSVMYDWGNDKKLMPGLFKYEEVLIADSWNFAGYYDNAFYTEPFQNVLLKNNHTEVKIKETRKFTHQFRIKAPLLKKGETICLLGSAAVTGKWTAETPVLLSRKTGEDFHSVSLDLTKVDFPLIYKYGVYDTISEKFLRYEDGKNRILFQAHAAAKNKISIVNDGFIILPDNTWKGAGVSIPVFSLRSKNSWGVGEFADIKLLVDWAKKTGLQLIQILPVNDTNATGTWSDSYPYAAISAFALHPMYINPDALATKKNKKLLDAAKEERLALNEKDTVDYEGVNNLKWKLLKEIYALQKKETFASATFKAFYKKNQHWLAPYSAFCYYRDLYNTSDFNNWPAHKIFDADEVTKLLDSAKTADAVLLH